MNFLTLVCKAFGTPPDAFLITTLTVFCIVVILRRCTQFHPRTARVNKTEWGKALLTIVTILLGVAMAFAAKYAGLYTASNPVALAWVGFWNGVLATTGWQFAKRFPALRQFVQGKNGS